MKKYYITIGGLHLLNVVYIVVHTTLLLIVRNAYVNYSFTLTKLNLALSGVYYIGMVMIIISISRYKKTNILQDILILDLPCFISITIFWWQGYIFNMIGYESGVIRDYLRALISANETTTTLFIVGGLMVGMEITRFINYIKERKEL